ncbi:unnamed protein product [Rhodiola kirilowii]
MNFVLKFRSCFIFSVLQPSDKIVLLLLRYILFACIFKSLFDSPPTESTTPAGVSFSLRHPSLSRKAPSLQLSPTLIPPRYLISTRLNLISQSLASYFNRKPQLPICDRGF